MNNKYAYIAYNKRSAATGAELFKLLKEKQLGGYIWRYISSGKPEKNPSVILRWGNSSLPTGEALEINTKEAVLRAADKLEMAKILSQTEGVKFPLFIPILPNTRLGQGNWFVRDKNDHINYRNGLQAGDKYAVQEINKVREFRVHVFDDKVLGVYEKIPHVPGDKILKAENSRFKRLDLGERAQRDAIQGVRPMAKLAVKALGLVHGGVDVIQDANNNVYVLEVNSAPALNELNLGRWIEAFEEYFIAKINVPPVQNAPQARRVVQPQAPVRPAEEEVTKWLHEQAALKGYKIESIKLK